MEESIAFYEKQLGLRDAVFTHISHEDTLVAIVYKVEPATDAPLILKICPSPKHFRCEVYFLNKLTGVLPVPKIIDIVEPSQEHAGAVLMECLPGALLQRTQIDDDFAYQLGSCLALIHSNRVWGYGDVTQPHSLCVSAQEYFKQKFDESLGECAGHLPDATIKRCEEIYAHYQTLLDQVDGPCLTHRDFRPGNVMVLDHKISGIIDWSSGYASFAEEELANIEHEQWLPEAHKQAFFAGYASIRTVPDYQAVLPLLRLSKALGVVGFMLKRPALNDKENRLYQINRQALDLFLK